MAYKLGFLSSNLFFMIMICFLVMGNNYISEAQMVPALFVLGDSLVDVGNNNYLSISLAKADFPHNGIDFPTHKPTGRFTNGKNSADFLADKVGLPTSPPYLSLVSKSNSSIINNSSFLTGVSFASGGAGIFDGTDERFRQSIPLTKQVDYLLKVCEKLKQQLGSSSAQKLLSKSLFLVVIGSNDIFGYSDSKNTTSQQFVDLMALTLKEQLKRMYSGGARKFAITGIGAIGCCPSQRSKNKTGECNEETNSLSIKYNQALTSMLQKWKSEVKDMSYSYTDSYSILQNFIENPQAYGFADIKAACCGLGNLNARVACLPISTYCSNRRDHLFWDLYHPTEVAHRLIIDNLFDGSSKYAFPMNVRQLVAV